MNVEIENSPLSNKLKNILVNCFKFYRIKDLHGFDEKLLLEQRNLGKKSVSDLQCFLTSLGLSLNLKQKLKPPSNKLKT